jgi:hypothetical protein
MIHSIMTNWGWWGLGTGIFWGTVAVFLYARPPYKYLCFKHREERWCSCWGGALQTVFIAIYQFFFNFVGGFAGWLLLHLAYERYFCPCSVDGTTIILLLLALLGISGKLSAVIWELPNAVKNLLESLAKKVIG